MTITDRINAIWNLFALPVGRFLDGFLNTELAMIIMVILILTALILSRNGA